MKPRLDPLVKKVLRPLREQLELATAQGLTHADLAAVVDARSDDFGVRLADRETLLEGECSPAWRAALAHPGPETLPLLIRRIDGETIMSLEEFANVQV